MAAMQDSCPHMIRGLEGALPRACHALARPKHGRGLSKSISGPSLPHHHPEQASSSALGELYRREPANKVRGVVGREGKRLGTGKSTDHSGGAMGPPVCSRPGHGHMKPCHAASQRRRPPRAQQSSPNSG